MLQKQRNLKLIVASATVDAEQLYNFFNHNSSQDMSKDTSVILSVEGRLYPVDIHYVKGNNFCFSQSVCTFFPVLF